MASIYDIKPAFQNLLRPLTRALAGAGVTANQVTVAAAALSAAVGACIWLWPAARWPLLLLPGFLFVRMALNAIDGMLAREHNMKSRLGAVLNEIGDVLADTALYLPLAGVAGFSPWLVVVITILAIVSEMTGVVAVQIGASRRYDGPMGKSDRAFVFGLLTLLLGLGVPPGDWLLWAQVLVGALLVVTIMRRARRALAEAG
ncbi:CDP-alcohol phosphatidyltransferase family protein [Oleiharenicola lentus]|uniref:CDP-alcohol phosphatidyltransferase family protein n=1 Tax=Oleiharenicola lentus TaxID=2508720 RepID=A0A4Q1CC98_9BACT|nr:CDP-alcohol phosphatidyltransferase family protein [Oleiharenicola lentus]RXK56745.1 CDP-alcohol phosphatidyltransferase family protein [Oleiharenicola lentus]